MGPRSRRLLLLGLLVIAAMFRLAASDRLPVVHDEVHVVAYGLARAFLADDPADALLFETPLAVSNGITPLWWWLQAGPGYAFGITTKAGLRVLPICLGLASVAVAFVAGERLRSTAAGWLAGLLFAAMPLAVYTNARGEFAESLIALALLALVADLARTGDRSGGAQRGVLPLRLAVWPAIALPTYLGKGVLVWGAFAVAVAALWGLGRVPWGDPRRLSTPRALALVGLPWIPTGLWLWAAELRVFGDGPMITDIGPVASVGESIRKLTLGYGTEVKDFMVSTWSDALYVYTDFAVWPVLACLALPIVAVFLVYAHRLTAALRARDAVAAEAALLPLALSLPILCALLAKGALGARFHLLYLAPLLPYVGALFDEWLCAWVRERRAARGVTAAVSLALVGISASWGVLDWGRRLAWEPGPRADQPPYPVERYANPELQLVRFYLARELSVALASGRFGADSPDATARAQAEVFARAHPLVRHAFDAHPDDPATLREAGENLLHFSPPDREHVVEAWRRHLLIHPDDEEVQALLEREGI